MAEQVWRFQEKLLTDRLFDCFIGDMKTSGLLILQSPIIALLIGWRFHVVTPSDFLYFSLALSSLWFGCTNGARELVKERQIFMRERRNGLLVAPYILSKLRVYGLLAAIQSFLLIMIVNYFVPLQGMVAIHVLAAFMATMSGLALGLLVSSLVSSVHQADAMIPLVLIPQIIFSPIVLPDKYLQGYAKIFDSIMPLKWAFQVFSELAEKEIDINSIVFSLFFILLLSTIMVVLTGFVQSKRNTIY